MHSWLVSTLCLLSLLRAENVIILSGPIATLGFVLTRWHSNDLQMSLSNFECSRTNLALTFVKVKRQYLPMGHYKYTFKVRLRWFGAVLHAPCKIGNVPLYFNILMIIIHH